MDKKTDCFPFPVIGAECDTPEAAWKSFEQEKSRLFGWVVGNKMWRVTPELHTDWQFNESKAIYVVKGRALAYKDPFPEEEARQLFHEAFDGLIHTRKAK